MFHPIPDVFPPSFFDAVATEDQQREIARLVDRAEKDPRTHTFARLADLYRKGGDLEQALEVITQGLRHHPHYLNAQLVHAKVLKELGRSDEARTAFERVRDDLIDLNPLRYVKYVKCSTAASFHTDDTEDRFVSEYKHVTCKLET